jgi:septal ring factor EnvC (AmiA/AmiB activator)
METTMTEEEAQAKIAELEAELASWEKLVALQKEVIACEAENEKLRAWVKTLEDQSRDEAKRRGTDYETHVLQIDWHRHSGRAQKLIRDVIQLLPTDAQLLVFQEDDWHRLDEVEHLLILGLSMIREMRHRMTGDIDTTLVEVQ